MSALADMISCRDFVELVTSYAEGEGDTAQRLAFEQHLVVCPPCRVYHEQMRQTSGLLARLRGDERAPRARAPSATTGTEPPERQASRRALKFLASGRVAPISGVRWPAPEAEPGAWVRAEGKLGACLNGVHACRLQDLPYWLEDELWLVELAGVAEEAATKLVAGRGRLVSRVSAWDDAARRHFVDACAIAAREAAAAVLRDAGDEDADTVAAIALEDLGDEAPRRERLAVDPRVRAAYSYLAVAAGFRERPVIAAFGSAVAAGHAHGAAGERGERERQALWLDERLQVSALLAG